ncbi:MAG: alpha-glucan family phosphorylase [Thermoleophilia bacterium]|nr:alpha-glucan family phosphorylase [Thermoleophilia bacterium]
MKVRRLEVLPNIPEELAPLGEIARNLWYSWNLRAVELFIRLSPEGWEASNRNPVAMLGSLPQSVLESAARDESFVAAVQRVHDQMAIYVASDGWYPDAHPEAEAMRVAYFSLEFGLDVALPLYAGGLGVLAGDHLKSSSDLGIPLVGVGLLYAQGYFHQALNLDGWQQEAYPPNDWFTAPVELVRGRDGRAVRIEIDLGGEPVAARVWRAQVGRIPLYLLDSNVQENSPRAREITGTLYGGDRDMRIRQEVLLGVGGIRALEALGIHPTVCHMNEGHSAFLALERIRLLMQQEGLTFPEAREAVNASTVFTTHTPVPAGNEVFDPDLVRRYMEPLANDVGLGWDALEALGQQPGQDHREFGMTVLALRTADFANGVSALHGDTSRRMWRHLWPGLGVDEVPITSITNGIHTRTWLSREMADLFDRYIGPAFIERPHDQSLWERAEQIPPGELWRVTERRRERLVFFARERLRAQRERRGASRAALRAAEEALSPDTLTIGFARRFATYKRADLLFRQPERLLALLGDEDRPVQIIFAGKAHPQDVPGKELIKSVAHVAQDARVAGRVAFLEDYDMAVARYLVQGCDVWLNAPRRPMEASGTSGMKAACNGTINVSVLDGWWVEGYDPSLGWAIGSGEVYADPEEQDAIECDALFSLLEQEIVPTFYRRDRGGVPREWVGMQKACIRRVGAVFNTHRMVREYTERCYLPAHLGGQRLAGDGFRGARDLAAWRARVEQAWPRVTVRGEDGGEGGVKVGETLEVGLWARLDPLTPADVVAEVAYGPTSVGGDPDLGSVVVAEHAGREGGEERFVARIPLTKSGRMAYAARVRPRHPADVNPLTPLMLTWE